MRQSNVEGWAVAGAAPATRASTTARAGGRKGIVTRKTSSFEAAGERECRLDLLVELQQLPPGARVQPLGAALRGAQRAGAEPVRQRAPRAHESAPRRGRIAHQLVLERHHGLVAAGIALAPAATEELAVDASRFVALGGDHV